MIHSWRKWAPGTRLVVIVALLLLLAALGAAFLNGTRQNHFSSHPPTDVPAWFTNKLNEIEAELRRPISSQNLNRLAEELQQHISERPLPREDQFQFGTELIIRDLRSAATLQYSLELKNARKGQSPSDSRPLTNELEAIAAENNYKARIARTIVMVRQHISNRGPAAN